jgi:manganese oxidase
MGLTTTYLSRRSRSNIVLPRAFAFALIVGSVALAGCTTGGVLSSSSSSGGSSAAAMLEHPPGSDVKPTGIVREFDVYLHKMAEHELYPGAKMGMWGFSESSDPTTAQFPGPTLRVTEGDTMLVHFHPLFAGYNHTLHFHGQNVPYEMDGVPFTTQKPVEANEAFDYQFVAKPAGTYWYHCHVDAQHHVDMGMYGMLIVDPQDRSVEPSYDKEFVIELDDMDRFHLEGGQPATGNLPQSGDPAQYQEWLDRQVSDSVNRNPTVSDQVTGTPLRPDRPWTPVTYAPYTATYNTFLINGYAFPNTATLVVADDDIIRVRMLNAGNSMMSMHLHGHHMLITHKDGVLLNSPYWVDVIVLGPGERYDAYVKMDNPGLWEFHDHFGQHTQNDNIFPGGAMTMLCYDSIEGCEAMGGDDHEHGGSTMKSGDLLAWRWRELSYALP